jgi:hypothetical protein
VIDTASPRSAAPAQGPVGGLGAATVVVLVLVVTLVAGLLSAASGRGFGIAFNLVYLIVTVYAALRVHVQDRWVAVVAPPLLYALTLVVAGFVDSEETSHTLQRVIENTFVNLSFGGLWLLGATATALVIALVRGRRASVASRRHR